MNIQTVAQPDLKRARGTLQVKLLQHLCKHRASRACHPAIEPVQSKPFKGLGHAGTKSLGNALQVVTAKTECICSEARDCSSFTVSFQAGVREDQSCFQPFGWFNH